MQLKNIVGLCLLLACATATKDEKKGGGKSDATTTPEVIQADATAKDLRNVDCSKLTVKGMNALKNPQDTCKGLTAECAKQFDVTDLSSTCLAAMPNGEWKKLDEQTITQIINSKVADLSMNPTQLKDILAKIKLDKLPDSFSGYVVREGKLLDVIFETSDAKIISAFLTAPNVAALNPAVFRRFGENLIGSLNDDAFSKVSPIQLSLIPAGSFSGFTAKQWAMIPTTALLAINRDQAHNLSKDCWNAMTPPQIANFGSSVGSTTKLASKESATRNTEILDRRQFKENHPCMAFYDIQSKLDEKQAKALEAKCADVKAFSANGSNALATSLAITGGALALALIPALV